MSSPGPGRPDRRRRNILSVRLRTLLLMVGFVAVAVGWWQYRLRRAAVDGLLAVVPSGIALTGSLSSPERDPTYPPDRVRYMTELSRVAAQHGEAMAESELAEALRNARSHGDEKSMSGALAALLWMGQGSPASVTQITRTAIGSDLPSAEGREMSQVRCLAIHVLGRVAHQDDSAVTREDRNRSRTASQG